MGGPPLSPDLYCLELTFSDEIHFTVVEFRRWIPLCDCQSLLQTEFTLRLSVTFTDGMHFATVVDFC